MMNLLENLKSQFCVLAIVAAVFVFASVDINAQDRDRVVKKPKKTKVTKQTVTRPTTQLPPSPIARQRGLANKIVVVGKPIKNKSLVKKTASTSRVTKDDLNRMTNAYSATTQAMMMQSIRSKLGIRYKYGSQGPRTYDCSGFVWKVFQESGIPFTRTSARYMWSVYKPVYGKDRFKFGTLVFFNRLGHMGIVADENGFYHASSSKGVTYSSFKGYWSRRIVGYRHVPANQY